MEHVIELTDDIFRFILSKVSYTLAEVLMSFTQKVKLGGSMTPFGMGNMPLGRRNGLRP